MTLLAVHAEGNDLAAGSARIARRVVAPDAVRAGAFTKPTLLGRARVRRVLLVRAPLVRAPLVRAFARSVHRFREGTLVGGYSCVVVWGSCHLVTSRP